MQAVVCCLEAFADVPAVTTPLLKFMSEFVFNKSQRLTFDSSSANGILLFREVSKVLVTYGKHVLSVGQVVDVYNDKYKGIWVCLQVCVCGGGGVRACESCVLWFCPCQ
jgi:exportin-7